MRKKYFPKTLVQKLIFTLIIMSLYLIGREIPLYGVDLSAYEHAKAGAEDLIMSTIGGDRYKNSILALGISPYMFSMLFVQVIVAMKHSDGKSHTSPKRTTRAILFLMLAWSAIQAYFTANNLIFVYTDYTHIVLARHICAFQMLTGAFIILWLATRNSKYGIGGQTVLIYVNILDSVVNTLRDANHNDLKIIGSISALAVVGTIFFENSEYRIPMQRISIHSIYSDKNYVPIKLNPIGMMPVMFSSAFFTLPAYLVALAHYIFPKNQKLTWATENMDTQHTLGIIVYIIVLYTITILFALIFISPKNLAESMQKSGDSITGLRSGKKTRLFISKRVHVIALFSSTCMGVFLAGPLILQLKGYIGMGLISLPSIMIAMASINCNLYREFRAVKDYDAYIPFL